MIPQQIATRVDPAALRSGGDLAAYAYTDDLSEESLLEAARAAAAAATWMVKPLIRLPPEGVPLARCLCARTACALTLVPSQLERPGIVPGATVPSHSLGGSNLPKRHAGVRWSMSARLACRTRPPR